MSAGARRSDGAHYQVITLSATGDAETPTGGSVCIRCGYVSILSSPNLEDEKGLP